MRFIELHMGTTKLVLKYPTHETTISQEFGYDNTDHPQRSGFYTVFDNKHPGVDFALKENTLIYSSFPGIVVRKEFHQGMGNVLGIRYGNISILYAHLNHSNVEIGDKVKQGVQIALSGNTGAACITPHLHFELRDLSKKELKDMVFKPLFDEPIELLTDEFTYIVNNKSIPKTWDLLVERYFGTKGYLQKLVMRNPHIQIAEPAETLPDKAQIIIPNA